MRLIVTIDTIILKTALEVRDGNVNYGTKSIFVIRESTLR